MGTQTIQQGWNQATAAMQATMRQGIGGRGGGVRRTARRARRAIARVRRAAPRARARAHLVKGSPAAKRHMARLRKMVGRR